jgi:DNA topoisomerase-1
MILAGIGRYGPYVQHSGTYANLSNADEVFEVGLNRAVAVLAEKRAGGGRGARGGETAALHELGAHPVTGKPVKVLAGRYGPYIKHADTNANVPKGANPADLTLEQALVLLAAREAQGGGAKSNRGARGKSPAKTAKAAPAKAKKAAPRKAAARKTAS